MTTAAQIPDAAVQAAIDRFDKAAQEWGWASDQGYNGDTIQSSQKEYDDAKAHLITLIAALAHADPIQRTDDAAVLTALTDGIKEANTMLLEHKDEYHDYEGSTPESESISRIYHHLCGTLIHDDDLRALSPEPEQGGFDSADWFYRDNDPDDNGDTAYEAIVNHPEYSVHLVHSSFRGNSRYVFRAPTLDPSDDDDEVLDFEHEEEAIAAAQERKAAIETLPAAPTPEAVK